VARVTRPKVDSALPSDLVDWALQGRIRIPSFQRSYRWSRHDVTKLFDSIFRGYPIGNLLVWQRSAEAETIALGHLKVDAPEISNAYWIVDGQQRIISLVGALTATVDTVDPRFRIYFDLGAGEFVSAARNKDAPDDWMPVSLTLSTALTNSWIRARSHLDESQIALADQAVAAIRDYKIPMYIVTGDDEHALRDIFDRMNTYGQSLKSAEVFNALHSVPGKRDPSDLHTLASSVQKFGFGEFSERILMQSLLAIRGPRVDRDFRDEFAGDTDRHNAFIATEEALAHVVDFLRDVADISHIRLLPYSLYVPILARFCSEFGAPQGKAAELLRRWIWRGAVTGVAPQGNTIGIRQGASAVYGDPIASANRLLALLPTRVASWRPDLSQIGLNRAQAKVNILSMLSRRPRMLPSDTLLSSTYVDAFQLLETGQVLTPIIDSSSRLGRGIANRIIYPTISAHKLQISLLEADDEILSSHCIDSRAAELLRSGRSEEFLQRRAATVSDVVMDHVQNRALFGFRDGPDLSTLLEDAVDDDDAE
jgi:Protein of unknown function DUF262